MIPLPLVAGHERPCRACEWRVNRFVPIEIDHHRRGLVGRKREAAIELHFTRRNSQVRHRTRGDLGARSIQEFVDELQPLISSRAVETN